jgi:site-specific DNA recombinase
MANFLIGSGYVRTSSTSNPVTSIPNQKKIIEDYCKVNNIVLNHIFVDEAKTGASINGREEYKRLKKEIEKGTVEVVIIPFISRFGREAYEFLTTVMDLLDLGVEFYSVTENLKGSVIDPLYLTILGMQVEEENKQRIRYISDGYKKFIEAGKYPGMTPYGYDKVDGYLAVNEQQARNVKLMYEKYLEGFTSGEIANLLNESKNFKPDGTNWDPSYVLKILSNRTYTGYYYPKTKREKPYSKKRIMLEPKPASNYNHPVIIDKSMFEEVEAIRKSKNKTKSQKSFHLLSGLLYCPECFSIMYGQIRGDRYVCKQMRKGKTKCKSLNKTNIEQKVLDFLVSNEKVTEENHKAPLDQNSIKIKLQKQQEKLLLLFSTTEMTKEQLEIKIDKINQEMYLINEDIKFNNNNTSTFESFSQLIKEENFERVSELLKYEKMKFTLTNENEQGCVKLLA